MRTHAALFLLVSSLAACVGESTELESAPADPAPSEQATDASDPADEAAEPATPPIEAPMRRDRMKRRAPKGPMGAFMKALREIDLSEDQRAELKEVRKSMRGAALADAPHWPSP